MFHYLRKLTTHILSITTGNIISFYYQIIFSIFMAMTTARNLYIHVPSYDKVSAVSNTISFRTDAP